MSFLDKLEVKHDGALELAAQADRMAEAGLRLAMQLHNHGYPRKAVLVAGDWLYNLKRAHYWLMYALALELNP